MRSAGIALNFSVHVKNVKTKNGGGRYLMKPSLVIFSAWKFFHKIVERHKNKDSASLLGVALIASGVLTHAESERASTRSREIIAVNFFI